MKRHDLRSSELCVGAYVTGATGKFKGILYVFFWVFPRRLIVVCRRFGTLYLFHLHRLDMRYISYPAYEDGTDRVFRNVGIQQQSDAGEIPKRIHRRFKTRRKFEI